MRLCIPVMENKFLASEVSRHFGKAPGYLMVESGSGELAGLIERGGRGPEICAPVEAMVAHGVEGVACHGLGQGAMARLQASGIRVYHTEAETVAAVLQELEAGRLQEMDSGKLCTGHQDGPHVHDHEGHGHC